MNQYERGTDNALHYTPEFKTLVSKNPGILQSFVDIENQVAQTDNLKVGDTFEKDGIRASLCYEHPEKGFHYFKVIVNGEEFFVKSVFGIDYQTSDGVFEQQSLEALKEDLEGIEGVHVVDTQFAFQKGDKSYFVSKWVQGKTLGDLCRSLEEKGTDLSDEEWEYMWKLREKLSNLQTKLHSDYVDVHDQNVIVENSTGDFYLFDIFKKRR